MNQFTFAKVDRICTSQEYRELSKKGTRLYSDDFIFIARINQFSRSRLGITVSKKVGKAVTRNRIKRIIREYFRLNRGMLPDHIDVNVIARRTSGRIGTAALRSQLTAGFRKIAVKTDKKYDSQAGASSD